MGGEGVEGGGAEEVSCSNTDWLDSLWRFGLGLSSLCTGREGWKMEEEEEEGKKRREGTVVSDP